MIGSKRFENQASLLAFFNGSIQASGSTASGVGTVVLTEGASGAFDDVLAGDTIQIGDEVYLVVVKNSGTSLDLDRVLPTGTGWSWTARRGGKEGAVTILSLETDLDTGRALLVYSY